MAVTKIFKQSKMRMGKVSVVYFLVMWKNEGKFTRNSLCKTNETCWNEITCAVSGKPWFIYRIKSLSGIVLLSELA